MQFRRYCELLQKELIQALNERARILQRALVSELRLSEDEVCPLRELRFVGFSGHAADQRVIGVDFKRVVLFRHGLTRGFEHAAHLLRQHLILGSDHAGRGVNETGRHLHILNLAAERLLQTFNESLMLLLGLFLLLLFFLVLEFPKAEMKVLPSNASTFPMSHSSTRSQRRSTSIPFFFSVSR